MSRIKWAFTDRFCKWEVFDVFTGKAVLFVPFKWVAKVIVKKSPAALDYDRTKM